MTENPLVSRLRDSLLGGTLGLTSFDGHCVRIDFSHREDAEVMFELLEQVASLNTEQPDK